MRSRVYASVGSPSVCQSVCPVHWQQRRRVAGLLPGAGSRYRSTVAGACYTRSCCRRPRSAANAGSVMLRSDGRGSTQTCYPARRFAMFLCLSASVRHKSVFYRNDWTDRADACRNKIRVSPKIWPHFLWKFVPNSDLQKFTTTRRSSQVVVNLA